MKKILSVLFVATCLQITFAQGYKPGDKAKAFSLKNIDGSQVGFATFPEAKGFIVAFTCNHCPFAKMYEQRIIDLNTKYASLGYPVIAISPNDVVTIPEDNFEAMAKRAKEKEYKFPYLLDETQEVAKAFGATRTPHLFVIRKSGNDFVVEFIGSIDDNAQDANAVKEKYVENAIDALLQNKPVQTKSVKAIGCGIKWKS